MFKYPRVASEKRQYHNNRKQGEAGICRGASGQATKKNKRQRGSARID